MSSRRRCTRSTTRAPAPPEWVERLTAAAEEGGATLLVSGVDPGWGNDALAVIAAGLCTRIRSIHCQEIFDYSTYDQPYAVKVLVRVRRLDGRESPMMLLPSIPTMVWGGNIRLIGRGLGPGDRRDHRGGRAAAARRVGRHRDGAVREGHPGRVLAQGDRQVGRARAHRHRPHHPHPPVLRAGLAAARRGRRRPPRDRRRRSAADHRQPRRRARRHPRRRRQHHRGQPPARRPRTGWRRRSRASTTASTCRCSPPLPPEVEATRWAD